MRKCVMSYANNKGADQPAHPHPIKTQLLWLCRPVCFLPGRKLPKTRFVVSWLMYILRVI